MRLLPALAAGLAAVAVAQLAAALLFDSWAAWWHQPTLSGTRGARVLVTGSSKGIGRSLALLYCRLGARVAVHGRRRQALEQVAAECRGLGGSAWVAAGDMATPGAAAGVVAQAAADLGGLDIVIVNHVSAYVWETLASATRRLATGELQRELQIDLYSYVEVSTAAVPHLHQSNGSLVMISSLGAQLPMPYCYGYCFAKAALAAHAVTLRQELALNGSSVHVGVAHLGLIDTQSARDTISSLFTAEALIYADVEDTARGIASVAAGRLDDLVVPGRLKPAILLGRLTPGRLAATLRSLAIVK